MTHNSSILTFLLTLFSMIVLFLGCFNCANWGAHELGNNLVLLGGDRIEDRVIVYCTGRSSSDCCNGGSFVLPVYKDHMINGKYNYFVKRVNYSDEWIIAELVNAKTESIRYGLINLYFEDDESDLREGQTTKIIDHKVIWPLSLKDFLNIKDSLNIELGFLDN